jgi:hypothetical protein
MNRSWPYVLLAGICDFYFLSFVSNFVAAFYSASSGGAVSWIINLTTILIPIIGTVIYHSMFASKFDMLSPGELIAGRTLDGTTKVWRNPFGRNRWALFIVVEFTLLMVGNAWDPLYDGSLWTMQATFSAAIRVTLVSVGLVLMATGRLWGALIPILYYGLGAIRAYQPADEMAISAASVFAFIALANALVALVYAWLRILVVPTTGDGGLAETTLGQKVPEVVDHAEEAQSPDPLMKKYDITVLDGEYEYMGMLYSTFEYALAAAKLNRGDS